ncbi:nucleoside deaminase [Roseomonas nepalensis]|uniref:Nucleoside deaminase n=1 Tax=Muricoccus nepalensis TaxID=1854500 RepID=A0A502GAM2_9PROT|nr:nucleoside deaminase [Roseomonas nepalensis]TPG59035.1 nucleoside deaminase [Roseomonas nepalensis]
MDDSGDEGFMERAIAQAEAGLAGGQAPFGALVVDAAGAVLGEGHNRVRADRDPSAHGEVVAIRAALRRLDSGRLPPGTTLYTSCEPCLMCAVVIAQLGIGRVVYAARGTDVPGAKRLLDADLSQAAPWIRAQPGWTPVALRGDLLRERALRCMAAFDWG